MQQFVRHMLDAQKYLSLKKHSRRCYCVQNHKDTPATACCAGLLLSPPHPETRSLLGPTPLLSKPSLANLFTKLRSCLSSAKERVGLARQRECQPVPRRGNPRQEGQGPVSCIGRREGRSDLGNPKGVGSSHTATAPLHPVPSWSPQPCTPRAPTDAHHAVLPFHGSWGRQVALATQSLDSSDSRPKPS